MQFVPSSSEDIVRYYKGTYVKFPEHGEKLFRISHVSSREITGSDEDGDEFVLYMKEDMPYEVDFILPKKSFFQYGKLACLLSRIPAKQYQRGICEGNTQIMALSKEGWVVAGIEFKTLKAYVNKQNFPSLDEAIRNVDKATSIALSTRMAVSLYNKRIYVDDIWVASLIVGPKINRVEIRESIFVPELKELVKGTSFEGSV